jgi:thiol-disulfide isomerase/thioredoxin
MKTNLALLLLLSAWFCQAQEQVIIAEPDDPFRKVISKLYLADAMSFQSEFHKKGVFEYDTSVTKASVQVRKTGNSIAFLNIIGEDPLQELLFYRDTTWVVKHPEKKLFYAGQGIKSAESTQLGPLFPFAFFALDTAFYRQGKFWEEQQGENGLLDISIFITESSDNISDMRYVITLDTLNHLILGTTEYAMVMNADFIYQKRLYSGYRFPDPSEIRLPGYFFSYNREFGDTREALDEHNDTLSANQQVHLQAIELFTLEGEAYALPEKGLVFIDLWYVGCLPCMKAAPVIEKLNREFAGKVLFLSVNETDKDVLKIQKFAKKMGLTSPVLQGGKEKLALQVTGSNAYPVFFLTDAATGSVLWKMEGFNEDLENRIREAVYQYLDN